MHKLKTDTKNFQNIFNSLFFWCLEQSCLKSPPHSFVVEQVSRTLIASPEWRTPWQPKDRSTKLSFDLSLVIFLQSLNNQAPLTAVEMNGFLAQSRTSMENLRERASCSTSTDFAEFTCCLAQCCTVDTLQCLGAWGKN